MRFSSKHLYVMLVVCVFTASSYATIQSSQQTDILDLTGKFCDEVISGTYSLASKSVGYCDAQTDHPDICPDPQGTHGTSESCGSAGQWNWFECWVKTSSPKYYYRECIPILTPGLFWYCQDNGIKPSSSKIYDYKYTACGG